MVTWLFKISGPLPNLGMVMLSNSNVINIIIMTNSVQRVIIPHMKGSLETPKLIGRLTTPRTIMHNCFKVKGQRSRSPCRLMLRPEVRDVFQTGRPTNFKIATPMEHNNNNNNNNLRQFLWRRKTDTTDSRAPCYQLPRPAIKVYKMGYCTRAGHTMSAAQLVKL